ncbi:flagella basal body P-ring formation protein FlgA [Vitreimonas flagellata]|uniref:flagella basal body P-ring formation protein FlgA n=1 Tax=Vitreimonas flagellata TaxID=2560861 RepID=UPI0010752E15|nr:flagella basal body P-ring formation protein FlgA [Vitreimonas flagellata]
MTPSPILAALLGAVPMCTVTPHDDIALDTPAVRLSDVVALECVEESARDDMGAHALLDLSERSEIRLSRGAIAALARRRVPLLRFDQHQQGDVRLRFNDQRLADAAPASCLRVLSPLDADTILASHMVAPAACDDVMAEAPIVRDAASGFARTREALQSGAIIPHTLVAPTARTRKGDRLTLVIGAGPVTITRPVEALQDASPGESLFVRDADGEIFSMPLGESAP